MKSDGEKQTRCLSCRVEMELPQNISDDASETGSLHAPLISGLPDDIAFFCLARVPRRYHPLLRCVSSRWRALVSSKDWHTYRQKHNLEEACVYALCRDNDGRGCCYILDTLKRCWKPIQGIPPQCLKRKNMACAALGKKLYLLGGFDVVACTNEVYCYDASTNKWEEAAPLSIARCSCVSEALNGRLYAIGGMGSDYSSLFSFESYDPDFNSWTLHSGPTIDVVQESAALDGKIFVRCSWNYFMSYELPNILSNEEALEIVAYDPLIDTWQDINDKHMATGWRGPAVVVDGTLYVLDQNLGTKLMMWREDSKEWVVVGKLSMYLSRPPCHLVAVGKSIFVIGKELSTVIVDLDTAANVDGVMVCHSIPKIDGISDVIGCKALSI